MRPGLAGEASINKRPQVVGARRVGDGPPALPVGRRRLRRDVVGEILAQLPPDLRQDFQRQIDAGVPPEELEEALMRLVM